MESYKKMITCMNNELYEVCIRNKEMQAKIERDKHAIESAAAHSKIRGIE